MNKQAIWSFMKSYSVALIVSTFIMVLSGLIVSEQYLEDQALAETTVQNTARLVAADVEKTFVQFESLVHTLSNRYIDASKSGPIAVEDLIQKVDYELPYFPLEVRVGITNSDGELIINSGKNTSNFIAKKISIADRDYFQAAVLDSSEDVFFAGPQISRRSNEWTIIVAKRLVKDNQFFGLFFLVIPIDSIKKNFSKIDIGPNGVISLRNLNFVQIARHPEPLSSDHGPGNTSVSATFKNLISQNPSAESLVYTATSPIDNVARVYAYQRFEQHPFAISVGRALADFKTKWNFTAIWLGFLNLILIFVAFYWTRNILKSKETAEKSLAQRTMEIEELYNTSQSGYHSLNPEGIVIRINDTELSWLGYSRDEVVGKMHVAQLLTEKSQEIFKAQFPQFLSSGFITALELDFLCKNGQVFPGIISASVVKNDQNEVVMTRSLVVNYSEVRKQQRTLQSVLTASPMAVRIASLLDNKVLFMNKAFCELVRRSESEARDMEISQTYVDPEVFSNIKQRLSKGESVINELVELHLPDRPDIPKVWALASYMVIEYAEQRAVLAWLFDVTFLQDSKMEAEAANIAKSKFLATMSHEIRTPLNGILGLSQVLQQELTDPVAQNDVQRIIETTETLSQILNDILDFAKIEDGKLEFERNTFSFADIVQTTASLFDVEAKKCGIDFIVQLSGVPGQHLLGDAVRLRQIINNLLSNAVKFTSQGSVRLTIDVAQPVAGRAAVKLTTCDTGIGIEPEYLPRLFNRFEQGSPSTFRKFGGSGLGLAIVKNLVEAMGGTISVSSEVGKGTEFIVNIDFDIAHIPDDLGVETVMPHVKNLRILLVDDVATNREIICRALKKDGHIFAQAENGNEALTLARQQKFDVILMDLDMPIMTGYESSRLIRSDSLNKSTFIIALSGFAFEEDIQAIKDSGMNLHMAKPVSMKKLRILLDEIFQQGLGSGI